MTIREVAKLAGVSLQTVSNVINGRAGQMADETRERVLRSIRELGYQPNLHARGLRSQRTYTIGFLTVDPSARFLSEPFHMANLSGMADVLREKDYGLLVQALHPEKPAEVVQQLYKQRRFDGAVVHLSGERAARQKTIERMVKEDCPFVLIEEPALGPRCVSVRADNRQGAERAVAHLKERGHQRIAFLTTKLAWPAVEERQAGYEAGLKAHRLGSPTIVRIESEQVETARDALAEALRSDPGLTAVLCSNDVLAVGAVQAAKLVGRKVPDQLAVIGFDDFEFTRYVDPSLTTVALPAYEMGRRAANLLLGYLQDGTFSETEVVFPTTLVLRGSA